MIKDGKKIPCDGELWYRGYNIYTLIRSISKEEYGFEKITYLLLFGEYRENVSDWNDMDILFQIPGKEY